MIKTITCSKVYNIGRSKIQGKKGGKAIINNGTFRDFLHCSLNGKIVLKDCSKLKMHIIISRAMISKV